MNYIKDTKPHHSIAFINTEEKPIEEKWLDQYSYVKSPLTFFRLKRETYLVNDGSLKQSIDGWCEIKIKEGCEQALVNMIEGFKAAEEFID